MLYKLKKYIAKNGMLYRDDKLLLAVSGGIDSMVMAHLFIEGAYNVSIAHCNFSLRGAESDGDELLVAEFAKKHGLAFHTKRFSTLEYASSQGISTQMAARDLRYSWFQQLCAEHGYKYVATAHNHDDSIETLLLNLTRGAGLKGLRGMTPKNGKVVRPLLFASRKEIEVYAEAHKVCYREDSTNATDSYARNRIRHNVIPQLRLVNPSFNRTMEANIKHLSQAYELLRGMVEVFSSKAYSHIGSLHKIRIDYLLQEQSPAFFLFELLQPFGFSSATVEDIEQSLYSQPGKVFYSESHMLIRDREELIISPIKSAEDAEDVKIDCNTAFIEHPVKLQLEVLTHEQLQEPARQPNVATLDADKLQYPLRLRKWKEGDYFVPFGMKGKKKLSDLFTDLKLSLLEKQQQYVLLSGEDIVWVVGHRVSNTYKVSESTKNILKITLAGR